MKLRAWIVGLVVLASCGSSDAKTAAGPSTTSSSSSSTGSTPAVTPVAARCGPASAKTLAADGRVRVYVLHQDVYGCSVARGRSFRLGHAVRALAQARVGPLAVAGDLAAYGVQSVGVDTVSASVVVRRLTDGTVLKELRATRAVGAESFESIGSVVAMATGAVAWIGSEHSIVGHRSAIEVHASGASGASGAAGAGGAGGDRVLDSGPNIEPASLRLHGSRLTWVDGGATRHATLR